MNTIQKLVKQFYQTEVYCIKFSSNKMKSTSFGKRLLNCVKPALPKAAKTTLWLLKITIPVTFFVLILNHTGYLKQIANIIEPFFNFLGLPVESAFVLITSTFTNVYSAIAVMSTLGIPMRDATIIALMVLISHGFIIESAIIKKSGSSVLRMLLIRLAGSILAGLFLNAIMPASASVIENKLTTESLPFLQVLKDWAIGMFFLGIKIISLVSGLFVLQNMLEEFGIIRILSKLMKPLMRLIGLPENTSVSLIVVNTIGLAYGAAVILDQLEKGKMNREEADLLNHHAVISHSQIEDPLLFLALGLSMHWLIWPRILLAIITVWLRRLELSLKQKKKPKLRPAPVSGNF